MNECDLNNRYFPFIQAGMDTVYHWFLCFIPSLVTCSLALFALLVAITAYWCIPACIVLLLYFAFIVFTEPTTTEIVWWQWLYRKTHHLWPRLERPTQFPVHGTPFPSQCIYAIHPHGLALPTLLTHGLTLTSGLYTMLQTCSKGAHPFVLKVPFMRELLLYYGTVTITKSILESELKRGRTVALIPGGLKEVQSCRDGVTTERWYLQGRKGFLELAAKHNIPIVPLYFEKEQDLLTNRLDLSSVSWLPFGLQTLADIVLGGLGLHNLERWAAVQTSSTPASITHIGKPFYVKGDLKTAQVEYGAHIRELFDSVHKGARTLEIL